VAGPITVSYNLPGIDNLKLTPDVIAKIFQREIKTWNDAAIKADNPDANLPATSITAAHRSDGSGTTEQFTKYLAAPVPTVWKLGSGSTGQLARRHAGGPGQHRRGGHREADGGRRRVRRPLRRQGHGPADRADPETRPTSSSLFTNEVAPRRARKPIVYVLDLLAAIPSVVYVRHVGIAVAAPVLLGWYDRISKATGRRPRAQDGVRGTRAGPQFHCRRADPGDHGHADRDLHRP
jgi:hypothetical protein